MTPLSIPFNGRPVELPYRNYKGELATRNFVPLYLHWGSNEWHPEEQWLLQAYDMDRGADRTFALAGFRESEPGERGGA